MPVGHRTLIMRGACQSQFRHGLPRDPAAAGERISLTLRTITEATAASAGDET